MASNNAYDFSLFETSPKPVEKKSNVIKISQQKRVNRNAQRLESFLRICGIVIVAVTVLTLLYMFVMCRVKITELSDQINTERTTLTAEQTEYTRMLMELESKTSLKNVEEKAEELGMRKLEKHQIEFFSISEGDKAEIVKPEQEDNIFTRIANFFKSLWE